MGGESLSASLGPDGQVTAVCWWTVALTPEEIRKLADGAEPETIRPEALVSPRP